MVPRWTLQQSVPARCLRPAAYPKAKTLLTAYRHGRLQSPVTTTSAPASNPKPNRSTTNGRFCVPQRGETAARLPPRARLRPPRLPPQQIPAKRNLSCCLKRRCQQDQQRPPDEVLVGIPGWWVAETRDPVDPVEPDDGDQPADDRVAPAEPGLRSTTSADGCGAHSALRTWSDDHRPDGQVAGEHALQVLEAEGVSSVFDECATPTQDPWPRAPTTRSPAARWRNRRE